MSIVRHVVCVVLCACSVFAALAELPDPETLSDRQLAPFHDLSRSQAVEMRQLPAQKRQAWIERVHRYHRENAATEPIDKPSFRTILFAARDPEAHQRFARRFSNSNSTTLEIEVAADPGFAVLVGDDIVGENRRRSIDDVGYYGRASKAWELMRMTLRVAPEFSEPVKKWARAVPYRIDGEGEDLTIVREWWLANRDAMRAGRYDEVQPGRTPAEWLEGLPETDPPYGTNRKPNRIQFGETNPASMKAQYAEYLEAARAGKPYPPRAVPLVDPATKPAAIGANRRRMIIIAIVFVLTAFVLTGVWMLRRVEWGPESKRGKGTDK